MPDTFKDGVGIQRCVACGAALRSGDGTLIAPMRVDEVEAIALGLVEVVHTLERLTVILEHAAGRNVGQLRQAVEDAKHTHADGTADDGALPFEK